jgi:hypothetical protein
MAAGVALDVIGRWLVQLFNPTNTVGFFLCCSWNVESETLTVFTVYLEILFLLMETVKGITLKRLFHETEVNYKWYKSTITITNLPEGCQQHMAHCKRVAPIAHIGATFVQYL